MWLRSAEYNMDRVCVCVAGGGGGGGAVSVGWWGWAWGSKKQQQQQIRGKQWVWGGEGCRRLHSIALAN